MRLAILVLLVAVTARGSLAEMSRAAIGGTNHQLVALSVTIFGNEHRLREFSSASPGSQTSRTLAGVDPSETMQALDFRPATSVLHGLAVNRTESYVRLYTISLSQTFPWYVARPYAATVSVPDATGQWAMSFEPVADQIRAVSTANLNLRLNPNTGSLIAMDTNLNPGDPSVDALAFSNPTQGASSTTLYGIDRVTSRLVRMPSPNTGTLEPVGTASFPAPNSSTALVFSRDGVLYALIQVALDSSLYTVDTSTGVPTLVAPIGSFGAAFLTSLAVRDQPAVHMDFDGDASADAVVTRSGLGGSADWFVRTASGSATTSTWGTFGSDVFLPSDFDGDGRFDLNVWRSGASAMFHRRLGSGGFGVLTQWGTVGDDPTAVRDYDGDGRTDIAVYRVGSSPGAQSVWYVDRSSSGSFAMPFGANDGEGGDTAAPGDYDGDARADFVVRRSVGGVGIFYLQQSRAGFAAVPWGLSTDRIVPGDWDGDGKDDLAVLRNEGGILVWYARPSASPDTLDAHVWGLASDHPVPADYDGDGKTDAAVWRSSTGRFYIRRSLDAALVEFVWGISTDFPVAASFVH